jgi:hypothetical protein
MLDTQTHSNSATDLRYALDVMEECTHLGLDDKFADKIRKILVRLIGDAVGRTEALQESNFSPRP